MPTVAVLQVSHSLSLSLHCSVMLTLLVKFQAHFHGAVYILPLQQNLKTFLYKNLKRERERERGRERDSCLHVAVSKEAETDSEWWFVVLSCDGWKRRGFSLKGIGLEGSIVERLFVIENWRWPWHHMSVSVGRYWVNLLYSACQFDIL